MFSLIVATRHRPAQLQRLLDSLVETVRRPRDLEVVLVVDADDSSHADVRAGALGLRRVIVPPGCTMGRLNRAGSDSSRGDFIMLLNDDVVVRTPGWDERVRACLRPFPDDLVLVHLNDTLFGDQLCTFPLVSRTFCDLAGGICPAEYVRYRIDDHIEDVFNLLGALGQRRTIYLPDVVFEHRNTVMHPTAGHVYASDRTVLAGDDARFFALSAQRKDLVLRLLEHMEGPADPVLGAARRRRLSALNDPFLLRTPGRQRVDRSAWLRYAAWRLRRAGSPVAWAAGCVERARTCVRRKGYGGLAAAVGRRLVRVARGPGRRELELAARAARYPGGVPFHAV